MFALLVALNSPSDTYLAAVADKSRLLAESDSPRIVLVGDSNLAFGVDSNVLKAGLDGRYHPVNMGLNLTFRTSRHRYAPPLQVAFAPV